MRRHTRQIERGPYKMTLVLVENRTGSFNVEDYEVEQTRPAIMDSDFFFDIPTDFKSVSIDSTMVEEIKEVI